MLDIRHYITPNGRDVFDEWLRQLRDTRAQVAILRRLVRVELGNFGDHKPCGAGVWELRIDVGPGYRTYYARAGQSVVVLPCGGDKRTQEADILRARAYWRDWQQRGPANEGMEP